MKDDLEGLVLKTRRAEEEELKISTIFLVSSSSLYAFFTWIFLSLRCSKFLI